MSEEHAEAAIRLVRKDSKGHFAFDLSRLIFSSCLLLFSLISIIYAIQAGYTLVPESVSSHYVAIYISLIICLFLLGLYEGLQIAVVELAHQHPESYRNLFPRAAELIEIENEGRNVERFLVGRQVIVVALVFILARITTFNGFFTDIPETLITATMHTGFLGVVLVVIVAQLTPQVLAAAYPVEFLNVPGMKLAFYIALGIETSGLAYAVWGLAYSVKHGLSRFLCKKTDDTNEFTEFQRSQKELAPSKGNNIKKINVSDPTRSDEMNAKTAESQVIEMEMDEEDCDGNNEENDTNIDGKDEMEVAEIEEVDEMSKSLDKGAYKQLVNDLMHLGDQLDFGLYTNLKTTNININTNNKQKESESNEKKLDENPSLFYSFPLIIGNNAYPSPAQCFQKFKKNGLNAPRFLLPVDHKNHIPPHIVALQLLKMYNNALNVKNENENEREPSSL